MGCLNQLLNSVYLNGSVKYSTELILKSNMSHSILDVAFYMHLICQFNLVHVKCDTFNQALEFLMTFMKYRHLYFSLELLY